MPTPRRKQLREKDDAREERAKSATRRVAVASYVEAKALLAGTQMDLSFLALDIIASTKIKQGEDAYVEEEQTNLAPEEEAVIHGPYHAFGVNFWIRKPGCDIGFDLDDDGKPDDWHTWKEIRDGGMQQRVKDAIEAQLDALDSAYVTPGSIPPGAWVPGEGLIADGAP